MAKPQTTQQPTDTPNLPPTVGRSLSVRILDEGMYDDLRVIMQTGCDASTAVRQALLILANVYYEVWNRGHYPHGVAPVIESANIAPYRPVRRDDQQV
ncbi:hypothetical protein TPA0910_14460 [Streptomyces hygroscopicus subsp. sporocinereus]|uniref:Uncharacterized protein n=1 Tax=Streptomyces hygroscopicus TaxID=1912 RepID=A0ABQ3TUP7_STRHY|nr:hypothetical protein [Streptomyces hygroscopicus]GHJ27013.1 hypothetical protein TPA0910_14460 [Streptomyces hygroscopicus]